MELSEYGIIVETEFLKIPEYHKRALLDTYVVMPNHIHCIITLGDYDFDNGVSLVGDNDNVIRNVDDNNADDDNSVKKIHEFSLPLTPSVSSPSAQTTSKPTIDEIKQYRKQRRKMIIPKLTGKFQMQTSKQINLLRNTPGEKRWQANYYDHIIRNEKSYQNIFEYIVNNPRNWRDDKFNSDK